MMNQQRSWHRLDWAWLVLVWTMFTPIMVWADSVLIFDPPRLDFGTLYEHETVTQTVLIIHAGASEISLPRVGRSCPDCVSVSVTPDTLLPGEAATLSVTLHPREHEGGLEQMVSVESSEGTAYGIPVLANVLPTYRIDGAPFLLTAGDDDDQPGILLGVTPAIPLQGTLQGPAEPHPLVAISVLPDPHTAGSYRVQLMARKPVPEGITEIVIDLVSDHPGDPPCRIVGGLFLPPPVHVYPASLQVAATDQEQFRILFIEQRLFPLREITSITTPSEDVAWEPAPGFGLDHSRINVYIRNQGNQQGFIGDFILTVDDPDRPEIRIPVIVDPNRSRGMQATSRRIPVATQRGCGCAAGM